MQMDKAAKIAEDLLTNGYSNGELTDYLVDDLLDIKAGAFLNASELIGATGVGDLHTLKYVETTKELIAAINLEVTHREDLL